jgi:hypothetical protein
MGQHNFYIFGTFGRYGTNLMGTFVEIVKKVQNQPTLMTNTFFQTFKLNIPVSSISQQQVIAEH